MRKSIIALSVVSALLSGCGSDKKSAPTPVAVTPTPAVNTAPTSADGAYEGVQSIKVTGTLDGTDAEGAVTFSLVDASQVKHGTFVFTDETTGSFEYTSQSLEAEENIQFKVSDGELESVSTVTIKVAGGDPLYEHQWHLNNTGQNSFAVNRGVAGEDINVAAAISDGHMGQGVTVAVVDDGLEIAHPDLKNNTVPGGSYNLITGSIDPTPFGGSNAHGTSVAGIIAAEGWNDIGVRGIAPKANLVGFNYLDADPTGAVSAQSFSNFVKSHGGSAYSDYIRLFNQSYGYSAPFPHDVDEDDLEVYQTVASEAFDGKGAIFVKSAGNGFRYFRTLGTFWLPGDFFTARTAGIPANYGLPFHNSHMSTDNVHPYNLVVSAINAEGKLSSYSSVGSNIFLTAPGGEYGTDNPAMVTTDRMGCENGYSVTKDRPSTPFDGGLHPLNIDCDYNSTMNGTSSAAPNTTGSIAVIMGANPDLSWRDIRHILAKTATKVDVDIEPLSVALGTAEDADTYEAVPTWIENAAGYNFHNFYGFGRVNVSEAVKMARSYDEDLGDYTISEWINSDKLTNAIPDQALEGASNNVKVESDLIIEAVQIKLTADHLRLPDLAVELISPAGTKSVLMAPYNGFVYQGVMDASNPDDLVSGYIETPMLSNAFYGEAAAGVWTIKVIDVNSGEFSFVKLDVRGNIAIPNEASGILKGWSIQFHGHKNKV